MRWDPISTTECMPLAAAEEQEKELWQACLVLTRQLEASLQGSRKALLALDLAGIEAGTSDQLGLIREFNALLQPRTMESVAADRLEEPLPPGSKTNSPELAAELRRSQGRILEAVRLQAALLKRVQGKLRVLANMLAGPTVSYGPLRARDGGVAGLNWQQAERFDLCRA